MFGHSSYYDFLLDLFMYTLSESFVHPSYRNNHANRYHGLLVLTLSFPLSSFRHILSHFCALQESLH